MASKCSVKKIQVNGQSKNKAYILIVEDEPITANIIQRILINQGYGIAGIVSSGEAALKSIENKKPNLILMDIHLKGQLDGVETAEVIRKEFNLPIVYITAHVETDILDRAKITEPFGYILKPINPRELNIVIEIALYKYTIESKIRKDNEKARQVLEGAFFDLTRAICRTLEFRDAYTAGHQERVGHLAVMVGNQLGLNRDDLNELYVGGLLHDIGKIGIPTDILNKTAQLTGNEFALIKEHPEIGYNIIKEARLPWNIKDIVYNHHEKLDGSGYPNGLKGKEISTNVRIITVCDVVEAMTTLRPYRAARTKPEVIDEIVGGKGEKYDPIVVDTVVDLINSGLFRPW